ncbi:MAG: peptidylprolyl isomerase [Gammaproteobacteria bacterium]|nr:peptidylprolyl isomerase [Gammaproteobacteria bacterium]
MTSTAIGPGTRVKLNFTLKLDTGEEVDSTGGRPAAFAVGDGNLLPGFERALFGLVAGDRESLKIAAGDAFGLHNEDNVQKIRRDQFAPDMELSEGLVVSFADARQTELPGVVKAIGEELVDVDFNHPLAGYDIVFEVEILEVEQVSNEIFRSG